MRIAQFAVLTTLSIALACSERRPLTPSAPPEPVVHDPWEDSDAEMIAIVFSDELSAPADLYNRVHADLSFFRGTWGDSIPKLRTIVVRSARATSGLCLYVTADAKNSMLNGEYHDWDSINSLIGVTEVSFSDGPFAYLKFQSRLNLCRLTGLYESLPGVLGAYSRSIIWDGPTLYAAETLAGICYYFRDAWGDIQSGCMYSHYFAFESAEGVRRFMG